MSKRFIDTEIFDDDWFMELSKDAKILWIYFITKCNHAGMIKVNEKLCKVQTDIKDLDKVIKELSNRILSLNEHLYFIPKFIEFQYPGFPNSKVRQQHSALEILKKYNLFDNTLLTVTKELPNSYVNDNDNVNGSGDVKPPEKIEYTYSEFYDTEIKKANDPRYLDFVNFLFGKNGVDPKFTYSLSLSDQISHERFKRLLSVSNSNAKHLADTIRNFESKKSNKYKSFYLTINTWVKPKETAQ